MWQLRWLLTSRRPDADMLLAAATCHRVVGHPEGVLPVISDALSRSPKDLQLHLTAVRLLCQASAHPQGNELRTLNTFVILLSYLNFLAKSGVLQPLVCKVLVLDCWSDWHACSPMSAIHGDS